MSKLKYIYWRPDLKKLDDGRLYANVHLLVGYNQGSITDLQEMAYEMRQAFPEATYDEICAGKIISSRFCKGFTIITWGAYIQQGDYPGWEQLGGGDIEYTW